MERALIVARDLEDADYELFGDETEVTAVSGVGAVVAHEETVVLAEGIAAQRDPVQKGTAFRPNRLDSQFIVDDTGVMRSINAVQRDGHALEGHDNGTQVLDGPVLCFTGELAGRQAPVLLQDRVRDGPKLRFLC